MEYVQKSERRNRCGTSRKILGPPMPILLPRTLRAPHLVLAAPSLLLLLLLLPLCWSQPVGEAGLSLPPFLDKPGMLNCVR